MALLLVPAQTDQSQNFPADCQRHCDERECASRPKVVDLPARCPSLLPTISIPHMFPRWGSLLASSVVRLLQSRTTPSICQWWYFHHLVLLYHLNLLFAWVIVQLSLRLPIRPTFSGALQNHPVMLIRQYVACGCNLFYYP